MSTVGEVEDIAREFIFEWKINNFFELSDELYCSPLFKIDGEYFYLKIYPEGDKDDLYSDGYISVYLMRQSPGPSKSFAWSFSLKTVDGEINCKTQFSYVFTNEPGWGHPCFVRKSELLQKKSKFVPSDILTIVCTVEYYFKPIDNAGNTVEAECSYCGEYHVEKYLSSHKKKCLYKPIKCPCCKGTVLLRDWFDLESSTREVKATKKLVEDLSDILQGQQHSDVTIRVKDREFKLHRNILAGRSPYFKALLNTDMKEKATGMVSIEDCEPDTFSVFIHFLYTAEVDDLTEKNVCELYVLANKYHEDQLKEECVCLMKEKICVDTFCDFIEVSLKYGEKELYNVATDLFCRKIKEIITSVKWQSFMKHYPTQVNELTIKAVDYLSSKE